MRKRLNTLRLECKFSLTCLINICKGILLQREHPGPAKERADGVEKLGDPKEGDREMVAGRV